MLLALSETWLDVTISDLEVCPPSYSIYRNRRGDGIAIIISNDLKHKLHQDLASDTIESLWIELCPNTKRSTLICCAYRPPSINDFFC